jgi:heme-NO-binding protein
MQGILLAELERYVDERYGDASWTALLDEAGLEPQSYRPEERYPDSDLIAIMRAVPAITPVPLSALAEDFGRFVAPSLLKRYGHLANPEWRTLELLENSAAIFAMFGDALFGSSPPVLRGLRLGPDVVLLSYASHRRLCALAKGLAKGIADVFDERVAIDERACMFGGAEACEIVVRQVR